ncbi:hypothetical protein JOD67_003186 [Tenggerimyces flavus]|nr:hypothetical protein [Tenggerimyces flavus]
MTETLKPRSVRPVQSDDASLTDVLDTQPRP